MLVIGNKKKDWTLIRENILTAQKINNRVNEFQAAFEDKKEQLFIQIKRAKQASIQESFERTTIENFAQVYPGIKLPVLQREGIKTVADLNLAFSHGFLIDGIGSKVADIIQRSLRNYQNELAKKGSFRIDIENKLQEQGDILRLVNILDREEQLNQKCLKINQEYNQIKSFALGNIDVSWRIKWIFLSKKMKQKYLEQFERYEKFQLKNETTVNNIFDLAQAIEAITIDSVWHDFQQKAAKYYALIEKYARQKIDVTISAKGNKLSEEILSSIEKFQLKTENLNVSLRGWQHFGSKYSLVQKKVLIGDEMGLGKTIEAIAVMAHIAIEKEVFCLVICPASIIINWIREIREHSHLEAYLVHGRERDRIFTNWKEKGGVAVTTYETAQRLDFSDDFQLDALIVDEAHYIKNPQAKRSQTVFNLTKRSKYTMYMTGTPIENNLEEMVTLVGQLNPEIAEKITESPRYLDAELYKGAIAPVYLRRNKEDVLSELPALTQVEEWVDFGKDEENIYTEAVMNGDFMMMRRAAWQGGSCKNSPKLNRLVEICNEAKENGKKVIIFSFFRSVIHLLQTKLADDTFEPITGGMSSQRRQVILDKFKSAKDRNVLLAQVLAGGVGLNIQAASIVIFCEPQLKPSLETQAIARSYRMGQTNHVFVYRLLTESSIDEKLMEMLGHKQALFDQYAKESLISESTDQAKDISEKAVVKKILDSERKRLLEHTNQLSVQEKAVPYVTTSAQL